MNAYGYWVVLWSVVPGLRLPVTCCKVGISRSEAVRDTLSVLSVIVPHGE